MKKAVFILLGFLILTSCNIVVKKRLYNKGYHVEVSNLNKRKLVGANNQSTTTGFEFSPTSIQQVQNSNNAEPVELSERDHSDLLGEELTPDLADITGSNSNEDPAQYDSEINQVNSASTDKEIELKDVETELGLGKNLLVSGDLFLYGIIAFMALASVLILQGNRKRIMNIARWAKANPKRAQFLIAGIQTPLVFVAVMSGYNLRQMGYELSDSFSYVAGGLMLLGLLTVPFRAKRDIITLPATIKRHRLTYLGMTLSALIMMTGIGNHLESKIPDSPVTSVVKAIDQSIFAESDAEHSDSTIPAEKSCKCLKKRKVAGISGGIACGLMTFLVVLLICAICGSACLIGFGAAYAYSWGVAGIIVGILLLALFIFLLWKIYKKPCLKREKKVKEKKIPDK